MRRMAVGLLTVSVLVGVVGAVALDGGTSAGAEISCEGCNVVYLQVDLMRPDHMGVYGYERNTTPTLDRLAAESYVFERNFAQSPYTPPATASVMTGTYTSQNRMVTPNLPNEELEAENRMLAEALADHGYRTRGYAAEAIRGELGFDQGFDRYETKPLTEMVSEPHPGGLLGDPGEEVPDIAAGDRPVFLFAQTLRLHNPYFASGPYRELFIDGDVAPGFRERVLSGKRRILENVSLSNMSHEERTELEEEFTTDNYWSRLEANDTLRRYAIAQYDGVIRHIDGDIGRLFTALKRRGMWNETVIVVGSSHGESLGEHGRWAHNSLRNEVVHTPLMIRVPGEDGGTVTGYTANVDIGPTLLDILGVEDEAFRSQAAGVSVTPLLAGGAVDRRYILAEDEDGVAALIDADRGLKYFNPQSPGGERLYNLSEDMAEEQPFHDVDRIAAMKEWLLAYYERVSDEGSDAVDAAWPYFG